MSRALTRDARRRLERRAAQLEADLRHMVRRCAEEGGFVVGTPDELRLRSLTEQYDEVELALLEDEYAERDDSFRAAIL